MIAIDTSTWIAFLDPKKGGPGRDVEILDEALAAGAVVLPPVVLTELLSDAKLDRAVVALFGALPVLSTDDGHWARAGALRAAVLGSGRKARLADTLIAQSCIDHDVPLVTRDADFGPFVRAGRLRLAR